MKDWIPRRQGPLQPDEEVIAWRMTREYDDVIRRNYVEIRIFIARAKSLEELFEETIDNKIGYSDPETARRMGAIYRSLLDDGYEYTLEEPVRPASQSVTMRWVDYENPRFDPRVKGFLDGEIEKLGNMKFESAKNGMELLTAVAREAVPVDPDYPDDEEERDRQIGNNLFKSPSMLIDGLNKIGAVLTERINRWGQFDSQVVEARTPRMRLRDEGLLRIFEVEKPGDYLPYR